MEHLVAKTDAVAVLGRYGGTAVKRNHQPQAKGWIP
jgi:hypothetical protein